MYGCCVATTKKKFVKYLYNSTRFKSFLLFSSPPYSIQNVSINKCFFFILLLLLLFLANILMMKMVCIWSKKKVKERDLLHITVAGLLPFEYTNIYDFVNQISTTKISFKCDHQTSHTQVLSGNKS